MASALQLTRSPRKTCVPLPSTTFNSIVFCRRHVLKRAVKVRSLHSVADVWQYGGACVGMKCISNISTKSIPDRKKQRSKQIDSKHPPKDSLYKYIGCG